MSNNDNAARVILALAAEADDRFIWDQLRVIQVEMFAAGPVQIKFAYFGPEGASQIRPCISGNWITNAADMQDVMDRGRAGCQCGCYIDVADILEAALKEAQQGPLQAVVIVGDQFRGDDNAVAFARRLRQQGTKLFLFQQRSSHSNASDHWFRILAEETGGAFFAFNPAVEAVAERLPGMLKAVTHYALGGTEALAQMQDNESAPLLLEQMPELQLNLGTRVSVKSELP